MELDESGAAIHKNTSPDGSNMEIGQKPTVKKEKLKRSMPSNIDPALAGSDAGSSSGSATPPAGNGPDAEELFLEHMKFLEGLREFIKGKLERGEYDDDETEASDSKIAEKSLYPELKV